MSEWRQRGGGSFWVRLQTKTRLDNAREATTAAMTAANDAEWTATDGEPRIGGSSVSLTPRGPVILIGFCDDATALESWLTRVAAELTAHGWSGKLGPVRSEAASIDHEQSEAITAAFTIPINEDAFRRDRTMHGGVALGWYGDDEITAQLVAKLVPWCRFDGQVFLGHHSAQFAIAADQATDLVIKALRSGPPVHLLCAAENGDFQRVVFDLVGQVTVARRRSGGWSEDAAELEQILTELAPLLDQGLVRRSFVISGAWPSVVNDRPPYLPHSDAGFIPSLFRRELRHLLASRTIDAYAIQILGDEHLTHAADLSSWDVRSVAPGRHLVRAPDVGAWLGAEQPDPPTLAQARAGFGDLILGPTNAGNGA